MNKLAIIIPAYKPSYLNDALNSIASQTDKRFTVYIGDDASPSNLRDIIEKYDDRIDIKYHRFKTNLGGKNLTAQWHRCIDLSRGEQYIWLFSDDDLMEPECVHHFYGTLEENPEGELFHFNISCLDEHNGGKITSFPPFPQQLTAGEYLDMKFRGQLTSFVVEFIFSRDIYKRVNGFESFDLAWGSDFTTWIKMAASNPKGIITIQGKNCGVIWRASHQNITPDVSRPILVRKLKSLINNIAFIKSYMKCNPEPFLPYPFSFNYIKFPLGEIKRNHKFLSIKDMVTLLFYYLCKLR
ncbi:MAG: glycosyltransferase [Muribaculaceae bacterium]|nr:glycosyltransferase [Muribaculaceae bacterium]